MRGQLSQSRLDLLLMRDFFVDLFGQDIVSWFKGLLQSEYMPLILGAVGLMIFLLVPEAATQKHLEILSEIAELLSDGSLREQMKTSDQSAALHALIANWQSAHATA